MASASGPPPLLWRDCEDLCPPADEIALALQDLGEKKKMTKKGKETHITKHAAVEKLAAKIWNNINRVCMKPDGMTKNVTRGKMPLALEILQRRRHVDLNEVSTFFHKYGQQGKVYLITNDVETCGVDHAINGFKEHIKQQVHQKNVCRTFNDGIRLACVLLDPAHREVVGGVMSKKKDRQKQDITGDPVLNWHDKVVVDCFLNAGCACNPPKSEYYDEFPEDEKGSWDPNDAAIFEHRRTGAWLKGTWEEYVRPKYKKALDKWRKETGGGDGSPPSFIDYCGNDRWLVHVYCLDIECGDLLSSSAGGRMPDSMNCEGGYFPDSG